MNGKPSPGRRWRTAWDGAADIAEVRYIINSFVFDVIWGRCDGRGSLATVSFCKKVWQDNSAERTLFLQMQSFLAKHQGQHIFNVKYADWLRRHADPLPSRHLKGSWLFDVWFVLNTSFDYNLSLKVPCHLLPREGFGSATKVVFLSAR